MGIEFTPERMKYIKAIYGEQADSLNESQLKNIYNTPIEHLKTAADQKVQEVQDLAMSRGPETVNQFGFSTGLSKGVVAPPKINTFQDALKGAKNFKDANRIALQYKQNQFTWKGKPIATWAKDGSKQLANFSKPNAGYVKPRVAASPNASSNQSSGKEFWNQEFTDPMKSNILRTPEIYSKDRFSPEIHTPFELGRTDDNISPAAYRRINGYESVYERDAGLFGKKFVAYKQGGTLDNDQAEFTKYLVKVLKPKDKKDFEVKMSKLSEQEVGELYKQYKNMDKGIIAKLGAKIDYIKQLNGTCPEGMEVASFGKGGCVKCKQKAEQKPMPVKKRITDTKKKC